MAHACKRSTLGGQGGGITRSRDQDHSGQRDETQSVLKIQQSAACGGTRLLSQLLRRLRQKNHLNHEVEVAVSRDCVTTLQPSIRAILCLRKKKEEQSERRDRQR